MDASIYAQNLDICILPMSDNLCRKYIFTFELSRCPKPLLDRDQINDRSNRIQYRIQKP